MRRVVYQPAPPLIPQPPPKNVHIVWDAPAVNIRREFRNLGTVVASPSQYAAQFGASLVHASQIPPVAPQIRPSTGEPLAVESAPRAPRLVGDVQALSLIRRSRQFPAYETPYTPFGSQYASAGSAPIAAAAASGVASASLPAAASHLNFNSFASAPVFNSFSPEAALSGAAAAYPAFNNTGYFNHGSFGSGSGVGAFASGSAFGSAGALLDRGLAVGAPSAYGGVVNSSFAGIPHGLGQAFGSGLLLANGSGVF